MIPDHLLAAINEGVEREDVEFKRSIDLSDRVNRAKFAKSISAMANTVEEGYYVIGVVDKKARTSDNSVEYISDLVPTDISEINLRMKRECLDFYLNNRPNIDAQLELFQPANKNILIVTVKGSALRPYSFKREADGIRSGTAFIRVGPSCEIAGSDDIVKMVLSRQGSRSQNTSTIETLESIIDHKERQIYEIEDIIDRNDMSNSQKIAFRTRLEEIRDINRNIQAIIEYLKDRDRFLKEIKGLEGRHLQRLLIRRAEEILSKNTNELSNSDIIKKSYNDAIDLLHRANEVGERHARVFYGLAQLYDRFSEGNREENRKVFDNCSRSIGIATNYPDVRRLRMKVAQILIDEYDELYIDEAEEALKEDTEYFKRLAASK